MNINSITTQIFQEVWPQRSLKVTKSNFSVNPTLPLLNGPLTLPSSNCVDFSLTLHLVLSSPLFLLLSLYIPLYPLFWSMQILIYILKGHMRPLLCRVIFIVFRSFDQITTLTYVLMETFVLVLSLEKISAKKNLIRNPAIYEYGERGWLFKTMGLEIRVLLWHLTSLGLKFDQLNVPKLIKK